jgi:hypothetical protein
MAAALEQEVPSRSAPELRKSASVRAAIAARADASSVGLRVVIGPAV